jgi:membrane-associated phospholipid phosphatase
MAHAATSGGRDDIGQPTVRKRAWTPATVAAGVALLGYLALASVMVGAGLVLTKLLIPGPVGVWDNGMNRWFVTYRTPIGDRWTDYASILAGTGTVLTIAGATAAILAFRRLWRDIGFLLVAFFIEFSVFLTTVLLVERPRPSVPKLDGVPATSSFPSGHVAAAIVLYGGLAILTSMHTRQRVIRIAVWAIAAASVIGVGFSRVYRGLHHPIDVFAGVVLGLGAILVAILAMRAARASAEDREPPPDWSWYPQPRVLVP